MPLFEVGGYSPAAVLDRRGNAHDLAVEPDQPFLGGPPIRLVRVLLQCPRDLDMAPGVLALTDVRGGIVTAVRALSEAGRPPVEVELRRVALAAPREIVETRSPSACISALADVQQTRLAPCPEPVEARRRRNDMAAVGLIEILPL